MTPLEVLHQAGRHGVQLSVLGDKLALEPVDRCPAPLLCLLKEHKAALIRLLSLPSDQHPWLHICRQIIDGEFRKADSSMAASLTIGLRPLVAAGIAEAKMATRLLEPTQVQPKKR